MVGLLTPVIIGIICIVIGISNSKGNIETLHSYHRSRVREEDKLPFGKLVGLGMIIIGISLIINGALSFAGAFIENDIMIFVATGILIAGLVAGLWISFYAMIKYNKGIF